MSLMVIEESIILVWYFVSSLCSVDTHRKCILKKTPETIYKLKLTTINIRIYLEFS